jgi:cytochrome c
MRIALLHDSISAFEAAAGAALATPLWILVLALGVTASGWPDVAGAFTDAQANAGAQTYQLQCARCHGPNGEGQDNIYHGMRAPELIGAGTFPVTPRAYQKLRHFNFHNLRDVYEFSSASMPADQPASLNGEAYWDVLSYLLQANGVRSDGKQLDESSAAVIAIPIMRRQGASPHTAAADR